MAFRLERRGPVRNLGASPGFVEIRNYFNFRSIKIGGWVSEAEKQQASINFFIALLDLQDILSVPVEVISLRGALSLHYGTGGQPGVSAHYQPSNRSLALAKNAGAGSLAHEWFHAFDHYIAQQIFSKDPGERFGSTAWLADFPLKDHPLCNALSEVYRAVLLDSSGEAPSDLVKRSVAADRADKTLYWSRPEELCARCFEAFIEDARIRNNFLANRTRTQIRGHQVYPVAQEREKLADVYQRYFNLLGQALAR